MAGEFRIRPALVADAALLARHRVAMFAAMGRFDAAGAAGEALRAGTEAFVARALPAGEWAGWIAEDEGGTLGSGSALVRTLAPRVDVPAGGREAYLLNFFVEPAARRRGIASAILRECLAWCRASGVARVTLHASDEGRPVYARQGFVPRDREMLWSPEAAAPRC